jgi:hypothetical protein
MEIVILACWNIWKQRNGLIFQGERPSFLGWEETSCLMYPCLSIGSRKSISKPF